MEKQEKVIDLKNFLQKGIIYEDEMKFHDSLFSDVYSQAAKMIENIVVDNREIRYGHRGGKQAEIENVISFIGRRGTGKTSAMLSFCDALSNYGSGINQMNYNAIGFSDDADMRNVRFEVLDCIDASLLESWERILPPVLANMLTRLENTTKQELQDRDDYIYRELVQRLEEVYDGFITLTNNGKKRDEYSSYEQLRNIASSQKLRKAFSNLVDKYLKYNMKETFGKGVESYLVIVIDDLDMSHYNASLDKKTINNKSYEMMKDIYEYLSIPGIIVVTAYNHDNLYQHCMHFFSNCNKGNDFEPKVELCETKTISISRTIVNENIASQYMQKVLPPVLRVYMPSWRKRDYNFFKISIGDNNFKPDIFQKYRKKGKHIFTVKQLIFILFEQASGLYFDYEGKKLHFLEPDSLRSLYTQLQLLLFSNMGKNSLKYIDENDEICWNLKEDISKIQKKIKNDAYFRFVREKLEYVPEKRMFESWLSVPVDRRGQEIVRELRKETPKLGKNIKKKIRAYKMEHERTIFDWSRISEIYDINFVIDRLKDNSEVKYSYAELIHSIYHMTRNEKKYSKELVECVLYTYNIHLMEIYKDFREKRKEVLETNLESLEQDKGNLKIIKDTVAKEEYSIFKNLIGETICGAWTEYYFPEIYMPERKAYASSYLDDTRRIILGHSEVAQGTFKIQIYFSEVGTEKFVQKIQQLLFVIMLYPDVLEWEKETLKTKYYWEDNTMEIELKWEDPREFELTSFFKYTFLYEECLDKIESMCINAEERAMKEDNLEVLQYKEDMIATIREIFQEIRKEYYKWDFQYGNMMLPIYNLDITYNLIKRLFLENRYNKHVIYLENGKKAGKIFFEEFRRMLDKFKQHLRVLDDFYYLDREESFVGVFESCPYMKLLSNLEQNEDAREKIGLYILGIAQTIADDYKNQISADSE